MVRIRSRWFMAVALTVLAASACKKSDDNKGTQPATSDKTTENKPAGTDKGTPTPPPTPTQTNTATATGDDLALLPADSEMVLGINFAQLQQSALWKQYAPALMNKIEGKLAEFKAECGFDPFEAVKSVSMGMKGLGPIQTPDGAVVIHGLDKTKAMACLDKAKAKADASFTVDGDVIIAKDKKGETTAFTFVNDSTLLGTMGNAGTKDAVLALAKGGQTLKNSQTFVEMYSKVNAGDSLWFLLNGNSPMFKQMGAMGVKPKAIFGSINVTDGLTMDMRMRLDTPDSATSFAAMAKAGVSSPQVKQFIDKLEITSEGTDVRVSAAISGPKLQQIAAMAGGMMSGMLGGMKGP